MENETETGETEELPSDEALKTSGHVERTILQCMTGDGGTGRAPTIVSDVLDDVAAVIERGGYANVGPSSAAAGTVRKSSVRRTFTQLADKGLVSRVSELDESTMRDSRYDLGTLDPDGSPDDPTAYARTSDDARVTDWVLTDEGRREVERLDARYAAELDELAARYGRPVGKTTARIDA
jgi:hypothetical protein